jgi:hypothetical protein
MSTELLTTRLNHTVLPKNSRSATRGVGNKKIHRKTFMGGFIANLKSLESVTTPPTSLLVEAKQLAPA